MNGGTKPRTVPVVAAIVAIAATYGYFLLFAEFAFLQLATRELGAGLALCLLLGVLGAGGITGSLLAAGASGLNPRRALAAGFGGCAMAAALATAGGMWLWWAAAGVGVGLGWTTVLLSMRLRASLGTRWLGRGCGLGTGLAYALSNLPPVFEARPGVQAVIALMLAGAGLAAAGLLDADTVERADGPDFSGRGCVGWIAIFLMLVWLDSAGFYVLQHTPGLRDVTWQGPWRLYGNALTHLVGAVLAGWALDARRWGGTILVALLLLGLADILLAGGVGGYAGVPYTLGVSAYSVALVYYPAWGARPWLAGILFAVAGGGGSALGIGMVQDLHALPLWFVALAGTVIAGLLLVRRGELRGTGVLLLVGGFFLAPPARADEPSIARGREVYIAEGCINCHSQYVRRGVTEDVVRWGPARPLAETLAESPPLIGIRRQGPDLTNVGNRRSAEWQRLHFVAPRTLSPGSRMPGYGRLFKDSDSRGADLVAYLDSLGETTLEVRRAQIEAWQPDAAALSHPDSAAEAQRQFGRLCASCHGPSARGDGPLATRLAVRPPDFQHEPWRHLRAGEAAPEVALARLIKFGVPGTAMAGHEYLDDATVVALARYVTLLHR